MQTDSVGVGPGLGCLRIHGPTECLLCTTVHTVLGSICTEVLCSMCTEVGTEAAHHAPAGPRYTSVWDPAHIPPHHITVVVVVIIILIQFIQYLWVVKTTPVDQSHYILSQYADLGLKRIFLTPSLISIYYIVSRRRAHVMG